MAGPSSFVVVCRYHAPRYDILYKQHVGSEDVYLGLGQKTPSTVDCNYMVVKVKLPGEEFKDLELNVTKQKFVVGSSKYRLSTFLPHPCEHEQGKAQWDKEKHGGLLTVTLPIIRDDW